MPTDFKKSLDSYKAKAGEFRILDVPPMRYLMVDGHGDPNTSPEYARAIETLYPVAYKLKFASKRQLGEDYVVPPLEALWWADDMSSFVTGDKSAWDWTAMNMVPEWIPSEMIGEIVPAGVRVETLEEGRAVQTLHLGPYDAEGPVLERLHHEFIPANGLTMTGRHHEIYLGDPRKTAPQKLRTILRQPVA
ncbi:GyrI-like domain-containing protein [Demequina sp.]|uniref:GyrI-like domain-containing protein n=1 Tax=Demequina sp. TaxID=2050685 RepID=UPI003D09A9A0